MKEVFSELSHKEAGYFFFFEKLFEKKSEYQHIVVGNSLHFGKCLFLDGVVQFAENDEFLYHESLVQPAVHLLDSAKKVLVLGGGDGLAARELFRHNDIEKVVVVDIDREVSEITRTYFEDLVQGAFEDPRLELHHDDASKYIEDTEEKFDIIVMDLTDPGQPIGEIFYSDEFFRKCKRVMNGKSIFITHGSSYSVGFPTAPRVFLDFRKSFKNEELYTSTFIDSYNTPMGFMIGYDFDFKIDFDRIKKRYSNIRNGLRFYSPEIHRAMFKRPTWVNDFLNNSKPLPKGYIEVKGTKFLKLNEFIFE